jgi:galactokinase
MPSETTRTWRAPGRVNIIGEHIDYLGGTVLPFACDLELTVVAGPGRGNEVAFTSLDPDGADPKPYVDGVVDALREDGRHVRPTRGAITSDIPVGAGLSSSAALAAGIALAVTEGEPISPELLQRAERKASGVPGGIMDQTAVLEGRAGHAIVLDCATGATDHVPIPDSVGFVVIDTGTRRALSDGRYAQRRAEVEAGERKRVRHAETEQRRVYDAVDALRAGDVAVLGALICDSHASLRDDFEVSSDVLDRAVEVAVSVPGCTGARLVGAGFAGCVLAVVEAEATDAVVAVFDAAYAVRAVDGAGPVIRPA